MTAGLDEWPLARDACPLDWLIHEERLEARLGVNHFRLPPEYKEHGQGVEHPEKHIPFVRFPRWHYCPRSGAMERLKLNEGRKQCECHACEALPKKKRPYLIQSPYVAVCEEGHIEDFPFMRWVHRDKAPDYDTCKLSWPTGHLYSGRFVSNVICSCGQEASLKDICSFNSDRGGALSWTIGYKCQGKMPWLGEENGECGNHLRVVQRDSSNVYFPKTASSIYIPFQSDMIATEKINRLLRKRDFWNTLTKDLNDGKYVRKSICEILAGANSVDPEELRDAAQRKLDGITEPIASQRYSEEELRQQEYEVLRSGKSEGTTELKIELRDPSEGGSQLSDFLDSICLIKKLRETRVFTGFSRLHPPEETEDLLPFSEGELNWMPATRHYGEGIFLEFNKQKLDAWSERPDVGERIKSALKSIKDRDRLNVKPKFMLLHTLAHVLIRQLSYDCGYGSASLRERVYCEEENLGKPMQGILIYTASGDSEGSLGGLVRRGEPPLLSSTIIKAIIEASWCSSDPVCIESEHQQGYGANLAACHSCVLLPETSCEKGNRFLDRGLLTGKPNNTEMGFFESFLRD